MKSPRRVRNGKLQMSAINSLKWEGHTPRQAHILDNDKPIYTGTIRQCRVYRAEFGGIMRLERKD